MAKITTAEVRAYLKPFEGQELSLDEIRSICHIEKYGADGELTESFHYIIVLLNQMPKFVRRIAWTRYKIIEPVEPVRVFLPDREERPLFELIFPRDFNTMMEMDFAQDVVVREGDLITIGGVKSTGKTSIILNLLGENLDKAPVIMGNEYTTELGEEQQKRQGKKYDIMQRFYNRIRIMDIRNGGWIEWTDENGEDRFKLLPIFEDYAEHIVKDKLNFIDWIDLEGDKSYDIGKILKTIKRNHGRGVTVATIQKKEGAGDPRGGQYVRDHSDFEILLDGFGQSSYDVLLTIRGCKESRRPIVWKTYVYTLVDEGTKITNFREVKKCPSCKGYGYVKSAPCSMCWSKKFVDA